MIIQRKAKNKYWQAAKRWRTVSVTSLGFASLRFNDYKYIIGDKIFDEPTPEAEEAFNTVLMWQGLQHKE